MSSGSSGSRRTRVFEGAIFDVCEGRFRHDDGEEVTRQWVAHPGSVAMVAHDDEHVWLVRQPREATGDPDLLELPAGKLDEEGEAPLDCAQRELAEEIGKARRALGAPEDVPDLGGDDRRALPHLPRHRAAATRPATRSRASGSTIEPHPLAELDAAIAETTDAKTLIGLHAAARAAARLNARLQRQAAADGAAKADPWPSRPPRPSRSRTCCSTSSPTWSSSAGSRATRSRPTAPTCSSTAPGSSARAMTRWRSATPS